jgi:hypothetical protein
MILVCARCGRKWEGGDMLPFRESCAGCHSWLHSCAHCRLFRGGRCSEPSADPPRNPAEANWCEWFLPAPPSPLAQGGTASKGTAPTAREKAEAAWKKLSNPGSKGEDR